MPGFPVLCYLPEFAQTHVYCVGDASNHLILCHPLLLSPSIFPSIRDFSSESALCIRWPKYWSFSVSVLPMNIQGWFPLGLTGLSSLLSKGFSIVFSIITCSFHQFASGQFYGLLILNQRLYLDMVSESSDKWAPQPSVKTSAQRHFK